MSNGRRLGQWGVPDAGTTDTTSLKCYDCGNQGVRSMTPAMAAMVPGGCIEVDPAQCGAAAAPVTETGDVDTGQSSNPWTTTQQSIADPDHYDGPIEITITVLEPKRLDPYPGANVSISLVDRIRDVIDQVASGTTNAAGKFSVTTQAPTPNKNYSYRVKVSPGAGQDFPPIQIKPDLYARSIEATQSMTGKLDYGGRTVVVDLPGTDPLVYEVAEKQVLFTDYFEQVDMAIIKSFIWMIRNDYGIRDNGFARNVNVYAPWLGDRSIKPEQWPTLTKNWDQFVKIWEAVPWPKGCNVENFYIECMNALPFHGDLSFVNPHLYISDFFPKTDDEIREAIARKGLENVTEAFNCIQRKVAHKAKAAANRAKRLSDWGKIIGFVLNGVPIVGSVFSAMLEMEQLDNAADFSKFMMGYKLFVEDCRASGSKDFICECMAPFMLWAMETLLLADFFDNAAMELGLPGAAPGVTQEEVVKPMVEGLKDMGVDVPPAAYTPGGVAPGPGTLAVASGAGVLGLIAAVVYGVYTS
jgi:DNA-binding Lrp family transcriptional regulator